MQLLGLEVDPFSRTPYRYGRRSLAPVLNCSGFPGERQSICGILISHAAHGLATSSLEGMGEITLRDSLIVAAAAAGAQAKQAWILQREVLPNQLD